MKFSRRPLTLVIFALLHLCYITVGGQSNATDSAKINYSKLYSYCLDAKVKPALTLVDSVPVRKLSLADAQFKIEFDKRFAFASDQSDYLSARKSSIDTLLSIYQQYWRFSLLDDQHNYDSLLISSLRIFFETRLKRYQPDSVDRCVVEYLKGRGLFTTGFGKTGRLYDLLVWRNQKDTSYLFKVNKEQIGTAVVFMQDFVSLGWEDYATLGKYYPGGWATDKSLFCVESAYDIHSEDFYVSYLAHESRHFSDYKLFPRLKSVDLEYRAKLTEISLAKSTLFGLLSFFVVNANVHSENSHSIANYWLISDLSSYLFNTTFEKNIERWKTIKSSEINKAAQMLLKSNTKALRKAGPLTENYINVNR